MSTPDESARQFFKALMANQCHVAWGLLSKTTQKSFVDWTLKDIYVRNEEAAQAAGLGVSEVRLMFERNDLMLTKNFWKQFLFASNALEIYRFGYFEVASTEGSKALVHIQLRYPDGRVNQMELNMFKEGKTWKLGFLESGLRLS